MEALTLTHDDIFYEFTTNCLKGGSCNGRYGEGGKKTD
jgi:hypothetical protein